MPLIESPPFVCPVPIIGPRNLGVQFPGGAKINAFLTNLYATEFEVAQDLLGKVSVLLVPFKVLFDIIEVVLAVKRILDAVPNVVTKPQELVKELKAAGKLFVNLATLLPQLSLPILLGHICDLLDMLLTGFIAECEACIAKENDIRAIEYDIADKISPMTQILDCARRINQQRLCAVVEGMAPVMMLIEALNKLLELLGFKPLPPLADLSNDMFGFRAQLDKARAGIRDLRRLIPTPKLVFKSLC